MVEENFSSTQPLQILMGTRDGRETCCTHWESQWESWHLFSSFSVRWHLTERMMRELGDGAVPLDNPEFPLGSELRLGQSLSQRNNHLLWKTCDYGPPLCADTFISPEPWCLLLSTFPETVGKGQNFHWTVFENCGSQTWDRNVG